ncbi:unnamed protein product [Brassicogethes aeneus]|uniref:Uncharacterized protein n=1 Tax=Brassicogethes aeneus TaxID=1431903 RepID=A0A9P0B502_BRAAE|nr:unnamed protein product [Brassicogethes aeneus]
MCQPKTHSLEVLVKFVMKVYVPMWFRIKAKPACVYGAKHLFDTIQLSRYLPQDLKDVIDSVIQRNGYFGHPENMLLAMLADTNKTMRELAFRQIMKIRSHSDLQTQVRTFILPKFNFEAADFYDLLLRQECALTKPPLLRNVSENDLIKIVENPFQSLIFKEIAEFPFHTQAVERTVKLVTEASIFSRNVIPKLYKKGVFIT